MTTNPTERALLKTAKAVFVHIPKTGGTSVQKSLKTFRGGHHRWHWYKKNFAELWEKKLSFSIVRNPWDRCVSAWLFYRNKGKHPENCSLKDAILQGTKTQDGPAGWKYQCYDLQSWWILDDNDECQVDKLLRFEQLQSGFNGLCAVLGEPYRELPHENATQRNRDYRVYYDDETAALVGAIYKRDVEVFGYEF